MKWPTKITVDKRIVQILSGSTYQNLPKAIKETIINSYDADASAVKVKVDLKNEIIIVEDNGNGLSEDDLAFFFRIAGKPRGRKGYTTSGRRIVGQFGVGFLAVFPFCKTYEIESKKKGSNEIVFATIPASKYFTQDNKLKDVSDILIQGGIKTDDTRINASYTIVKLSGFTDLTTGFFRLDSDFNKKRKSILNYNGIDKLKWELAEDLPLEYAEEELNTLFGKTTNIRFNVTLNGDNLIRPSHGKVILAKHAKESEQIGNIKFKYFISTDYKSIKPVEARYLKIRNLNVGVGPRTTFGASTEGGPRSRLHHLTGEIHILEGLNDLISVSRDSFNFSPDYEKLRLFFQKKLRAMSDQLEQIAEIEKLSSQTEDKSRIGNIDLLEPKKIVQRISSLKDKGFSIKKIPRLEQSKSQLVTIDKNKKEIVIPEDVLGLGKQIKIKGVIYKVKVGAWETESETFPACRIKKDTITINRTYPLFSKKRYTDIFLKLHVMLILGYKNGDLKKEIYLQLLQDILEVYSDYKETENEN